MERLTDMAHQMVSARIRPGDLAIDATAGNGHDTLFLARSVGPAGRVYVFDVQPEAILQTRHRLSEAGWNNVEFRLCDHANIAGEIPPEDHGRIAAVMFNLGYLPGSDKSHRTQAATTCRAIEGVLPLLREGGILTVIAYTGHPGGLEEAEAVGVLLQTLSTGEFAVKCHESLRPDAPRLLTAIRR